MRYEIDIPVDKLNDDVEIVVFRNFNGEIQANLDGIRAGKGVQILGILKPREGSMTEQNQIILTWQGNSLYMGKVCVGYIRNVIGTWGIYYPSNACDDYDSGFYETSLIPGNHLGEEAARLALESFIRTQAGEPMP